jgi:hypothetical protein
VTFIVATVVGVLVGVWLLRQLVAEHDRQHAAGTAW